VKALSGESKAGLRSLPEYLGRVLAAYPAWGGREWERRRVRS